jgi:hypothetical protein
VSTSDTGVLVGTRIMYSVGVREKDGRLFAKDVKRVA